MGWVFSTWRAAFREELKRRTAFFIDLSVMAINDFIWLFIFSVFFHNAGPINGWTRHDLFMLFAVVTAVWGVAIGMFANARYLGKMAADGELDAALTIPVDTLVYLLVRRVRPTNLGDLIFGVALFLIAGDPTPTRVALFMTAVLLASIVLISFLVILGSIGILTGGRGDQSQAGFDIITSFSMYPADWFGGGVKLLLYTAVPAGFIATMPAGIVSDFSLSEVTILGLVALGFATTARLTFTTCLKQYRSGSHWTSA